LRAALSDFSHFSLLANIVREELLYIILYNGAEPAFHFSTQLYDLSHKLRTFHHFGSRLDPRGNGLLKSVATVPGPAFKKEAPATMFDRHTILAIQGVQEAVVLDMAIQETHRPF
jgi:hypothetical protein